MALLRGRFGLRFVLQSPDVEELSNHRSALARLFGAALLPGQDPTAEGAGGLAGQHQIPLGAKKFRSLGWVKWTLASVEETSRSPRLAGRPPAAAGRASKPSRQGPRRAPAAALPAVFTLMPATDPGSPPSDGVSPKLQASGDVEEAALDREAVTGWTGKLKGVTGWWLEPRTDGDGLAEARIFLTDGCWHAVASTEGYRWASHREADEGETVVRSDKQVHRRTDLARFGLVGELPAGPWSLTTWETDGRTVTFSVSAGREDR